MLVLAFATTLQAQNIDSISIDGKQVYIYPFKKEVRTHASYNAILNVKKEYSKQMNAYYKRLKNGDQTITMDELEYMASLDQWLYNYGSGRSSMSKKYVNAMRTNPFPLLIQVYAMEIDIIPVLDPIPDGEYIQYFEDFCMSDSKGKCQPQTKYISGRFSIKNNALHGEAMWFNIQGDTLKHGYFENGLKEGEWKLEQRKLDYSFKKYDLERYLTNGSPYIDTTVEYINYENGAKNGVYKRFEMSDFPVEFGYFKDGNPTGEWQFRDIEFSYEPPNFNRRIANRHNDVITKRYTVANPEDTLKAFHPLIRKGLIKVNYDDNESFALSASEPLPFLNQNLFDVAFQREEQLDLEEELFDSHSLESMHYNEYDFRQDRFGYESYNPEAIVYDPETMEMMNRGKAIDSLGMISKYKGALEVRYHNGNIAYRYDFQNGKLVEEDTIFWSNGNPHDVITKIVDSNQYLRSIYDAEGKLYRSLLYDSLGDFVDYKFYFDGTSYFEIEGLKVSDRVDYGSMYRYYNWDTIFQGAATEVVVEAGWNLDDYTRVQYAKFNPNDRTYTKIFYAGNGKTYEEVEIAHGSEFENWTGTTTKIHGPYQAEFLRTGAILEGYELDSLKIRNVQFFNSRYSVAEEYTLKLNGTPYTGEVFIDATSKKTKINDEEFRVALSPKIVSKRQNRLAEKREKQIQQWMESGKLTKYPELDLLARNELDKNYGQHFCMEFLPANVLEHVYEISEDIYSYYDPSLFGKLEGYMLDGKPSGTWRLYTSNGKLRKEVNFENGQLNGTYRRYATQGPFQYYPNPALAEVLNDSLPDRLVDYLAEEVEYKNDMLNGKYTEFDWMGNITFEGNYKDGYKDGFFVDRNNILCSYSNFKNGLPEGYYQTYLTLAGKDSLLLYDINFQDGALQGKSQAYHINGQLAKKGFFLNGDPIDDYEAFDTLGFRYHYVKFKYAFPVEEKLWEENELSVRYLFDWEDSIVFVPQDITQTESLDELIADLGLVDDYLARPYFGRSTLVDKFGIKCHMTKYYPNDTIARDGDLDNGRKVGLWKYYDYDGEFMYQVDYFDTIFSLNDSIKFKSKGILTEVSASGDTLYKAHIIEKFEKYDCAHTDHYEIRQLYTIWQVDDSVGRMDGFVQNYYDNGVLQSEGELKDGLPTGVWKLYDPFGKLNQYGYYVMGKRDGRWLSGDLSKTKYLGDICLNPNLPDLEQEIKYRENLIDIGITNYKLGKALNRQYYDVDMNQFQDLIE